MQFSTVLTMIALVIGTLCIFYGAFQLHQAAGPVVSQKDEPQVRRAGRKFVIFGVVVIAFSLVATPSLSGIVSSLSIR